MQTRPVNWEQVLERTSRPANDVAAILPGAAVVAASALVAFAWFMREALTKLDSLQASAWDFGFDQQVVWNITNGHGFYSSFARSDFLTDHFEIVLVVPALIERLWTDPRVLLLIGNAGLAATAPAAFLMIRALLGSSARVAYLAALIAGPIPFWTAIQQAARDDFHPENVALALAMLAVWAGLSGRILLLWTLVVLVLACKEDQVYTVGVVGLALMSSASPLVRRNGVWVIGAAGAWLVLVVGLIQNALRLMLNSGFHYTLAGIGQAAPKTDDYYSWMLAPTWPVLIHTVANFQAWGMFALAVSSMCGLPLLRPRWLLLAGPPFVANLLSHHQPQAVLAQHYALLPAFPIVVAGAFGAQRVVGSDAFTNLGAAIAAVPLVLGIAFGTLPPGRLADLRPYNRPDALAELNRAEAHIPAGAPVSADDGLTPWLAARPEIHAFPGPNDAACYVVLDRDANVTPAPWKVTHDAAVTALRASGRKLLFDDGRLQVWSPLVN